MGIVEYSWDTWLDICLFHPNHERLFLSAITITHCYIAVDARKRLDNLNVGKYSAYFDLYLSSQYLRLPNSPIVIECNVSIPSKPS